MSVKNSVIYIDLASLLDLRQGYLGTLGVDSDEIIEFVSSDEYVERETDIFKYDKEGHSYEQAFDKGDLRLLEGSNLTYTFSVLTVKLSDTEIMDKFKGEVSRPVIWLNVYPFNLSKQAKNHIRNLLFRKLPKKVPIEVIDIPHEDITPNVIKDSNITSAFIYDFGRWVNGSGELLTSVKLPDTSLYFAPIYKVAPTEEDLEKIKETGFGDTFSLFEFNMAEYVKISFLPVAFYASVIVAKKYLDLYNEAMRMKMKHTAEKNQVPEEVISGYFSDKA